MTMPSSREFVNSVNASFRERVLRERVLSTLRERVRADTDDMRHSQAANPAEVSNLQLANVGPNA